MTDFQVKCFLSLSKTLSFTQTAENMFVSQPTLSRSIASLEQEIGTRLVERSSKTVELTAAGRAFARYCEEFLSGYDRMLEEVRLARDGVIGELVLGIQKDAFESFVVDLVSMFRRKYPQIQLKLQSCSPSELVRLLNSGILDFAVAGGDLSVEHPGRILLSERKECAVLPCGHPLADRSSLQMEDLRSERFVAMSPLFSDSGYSLLMSYAGKAGFTPNIVSLSDSLPALMMQVACGTGIAVLYQDLAPNSSDRLRFVPLEEVPSFKRWLLWDRDNPNPACEAMISCAAEFEKKKERCPD